MICPARSISTIAAERLLADPARRWIVFSSHRRACNLRAKDGEIITLVHPQVGDGPFHIVLVRALDFSPLSPGVQFRLHGQMLQTTDLAIDLRPARPWNPVLPAAIWPLQIPASMRQYSLIANPANDETGRRMQQASLLLHRATLHCRHSDVTKAAQILAGVGAGLTPAGDDFLLGVMVRWRLQPSLLPGHCLVDELSRCITGIAINRTTWLSGRWLLAAANGYFAAPWHRLAHALAADSPAELQLALQHILSIGASSGADALKGLMYHEYAEICLSSPTR